MVTTDKEGASYENGSEWQKAEYETMQRRASAFVQSGAAPHEAGYLAWRMMMRDRPDSGDNRRVCFECKHLRENARCRPGYLPLRFVLQRCDGFELKGAGSAGKIRTEKAER